MRFTDGPGPVSRELDCATVLAEALAGAGGGFVAFGRLPEALEDLVSIEALDMDAFEAFESLRGADMVAKCPRDYRRT